MHKHFPEYADIESDMLLFHASAFSEYVQMEGYMLLIQW